MGCSTMIRCVARAHSESTPTMLIVCFAQALLRERGVRCSNSPSILWIDSRITAPMIFRFAAFGWRLSIGGDA